MTGAYGGPNLIDALDVVEAEMERENDGARVLSAKEWRCTKPYGDGRPVDVWQSQLEAYSATIAALSRLCCAQHREIAALRAGKAKSTESPEAVASYEAQCAIPDDWLEDE